MRETNKHQQHMKREKYQSQIFQFEVEILQVIPPRYFNV